MRDRIPGAAGPQHRTIEGGSHVLQEDVTDEVIGAIPATLDTSTRRRLAIT